MCGIVGVVRFDGAPVSLERLRDMTDAAAHRGPDGVGVCAYGYVGLGHRRLAVIDLSSAGNQPMCSADGDSTIVHNGEVYNFREIRKELESRGHRFRTHTDTEVILEAHKEWGKDAVQRFNGMFAYALYERSASRLFLARDRYGIKPLYFWRTDKELIFASEIKSILRYGIPRRVDREAIIEYFTFQNILSDRTLFEGVRLLPPANYVEIDPSTPSFWRQVAYWDFHFEEDEMLPEGDDLRSLLRETFEDAVRRQLVSDVPVGSYLSGGIDSGAITSIAAREMGRIRTFSCGFDLSSARGLEIHFDERKRAEELANRYKTEHYEVVLHAGDMEEVMPELIHHIEDLRVGQCYPNFYVARLASKFVKVVLGGTGGDEIFGGYPWRYPLRASALEEDEFYDHAYRYWQRIVPPEKRDDFFAPIRDGFDLHFTFDLLRSVFRGHALKPRTRDDFINHALYFDAKTFLHGLLLLEDKIAMAHSLESRVPFLDNELVDLAMRIPASRKVRAKERGAPPMGKVILRESFRGLLPDAYITSPKQGFSAPDASWFRGESLEYVHSLLFGRGARFSEYLDLRTVRALLEEHRLGRRNHRLLIWSLLSFEWWLRKFIPDWTAS